MMMLGSGSGFIAPAHTIELMLFYQLQLLEQLQATVHCGQADAGRLLARLLIDFISIKVPVSLLYNSQNQMALYRAASA